MAMAKKKLVDYHAARAKLHDFKKYLDHLQNDADEYLKSKYTETGYTVDSMRPLCSMWKVLSCMNLVHIINLPLET